MRDIKLIQDPEAKVIDKFFYRFRPMIKSRARRQDLGPGMREPQHILEMNGVVRRFTRDEHEPSPLFQTNVGGAMNKVSSGA